MEIEINFDEEKHRYWSEINGEAQEYTSVTTLLKQYTPTFDTHAVIDRLLASAADKPDHKYFALSSDEIASQWEHKSDISRAKGIIFHKTVETYLLKEQEYFEGKRKTKPTKDPACIKNTKTTAIDITNHWKGFLNFRKECPWKLYNTEQIIFSPRDLLAGTPDALFHDPETPGSLILVDWKTSKPLETEFKNKKYAEYFTHWSIMHLPTLNYWHYALQINIYAYMLEQKGLKISKRLVLRFGEDCGKDNVEYYYMPDLSKEVSNLLSSRRAENFSLTSKKDEENST